MRRGFSLIELLVVVAIIALLAALLFPVFTAAREKARQATCASNMKQIGTAIELYVQDWDDHYFPIIDRRTGFLQVLERYLHKRNNGMWLCPNDPTLEYPDYIARYEKEKYSSYGFNE